MKPSVIRSLARRYAAGELGLDEYRSQRRKLIDGITSGVLKLEYGESSVTQSKKTSPLLLLALIPVAVAIGIVSYLHIQDTYRSHHSNYKIVKSASGPSLVISFMETNNWSDASLKIFLQHWNKLTSNEKNAARLSFMFPRLQSQLQEQIVSQQAVVDLASYGSKGINPASLHLEHLQQMAEALGVKPQN